MHLPAMKGKEALIKKTESIDIVKWNDSWTNTFRCIRPTGYIIVEIYVNNILKYDINDGKKRCMVFVSPESKKE